jgi:hypothetical protein
LRERDEAVAVSRPASSRGGYPFGSPRPTQIFGGYGFMNEFPVARFYRDAKMLEIGEGTSEVQRILIAREMGIDA